MSSTRKERGKTQNIFLIETIINEKERKFMVMGLTGNIYQVTMKHIPECTCPDFMTRNKRCKHIYFVLIKIMNTQNEDQDSYDELELQTMFHSIPLITNNLIVNENVKEVYNKLKEQNKLNTSVKQEVTQRDTNDLCPICLDDLENGDELDYCKYSCGRPIHKICFSMWTKNRSSICVFCRHQWNSSTDSEIKYINLIHK
jgi:Ring finger domain